MKLILENSAWVDQNLYNIDSGINETYSNEWL